VCGSTPERKVHAQKPFDEGGVKAGRRPLVGWPWRPGHPGRSILGEVLHHCGSWRRASTPCTFPAVGHPPRCHRRARGDPGRRRPGEPATADRHRWSDVDRRAPQLGGNTATAAITPASGSGSRPAGTCRPCGSSLAPNTSTGPERSRLSPSLARSSPTSSTTPSYPSTGSTSTPTGSIGNSRPTPGRAWSAS
jgi:hypothetical protein